MALEGKSEDQVKALAALSDTLLEDPKTRQDMQRLMKKANPNLHLPEIDIEDRVRAAVNPLQQQIEHDRTTRQVEDAANTLYERLRDDNVVSGREDFSGLVKYAAEHGYQTSEAGLRVAAPARQAESSSAEPTPFLTNGLAVLKGDPKADVMKDPRNWARNVAAEAIADLQKKQGRRQTA